MDRQWSDQYFARIYHDFLRFADGEGKITHPTVKKKTCGLGNIEHQHKAKNAKQKRREYENDM